MKKLQQWADDTKLVGFHTILTLGA